MAIEPKAALVGRRLLALAFALFMAAAPGCVTGLLYTDVATPLTTNMKGTPVGADYREMNVKQLKEPFFTGISIAWDSNAIGDIARQMGLEEIYYADVHEFSVLFGIFGTVTVRAQGRRLPEPATSSAPVSAP